MDLSAARSQRQCCPSNYLQWRWQHWGRGTNLALCLQNTLLGAACNERTLGRGHVTVNGSSAWMERCLWPFFGSRPFNKWAEFFWLTMGLRFTKVDFANHVACIVCERDFPREFTFLVSWFVYFAVLRHKNSISLRSWWSYDVREEEDKAHTYTFTSSKDL